MYRPQQEQLVGQEGRQRHRTHQQANREGSSGVLRQKDLRGSEQVLRHKQAKARIGRRSPGENPRAKASQNLSSTGRGLGYKGSADLGRIPPFGFLKGPRPSQPGTPLTNLICGTSRKRKGLDEPSAGTSQDRQRRKLAGPAPPEKSIEKPLCGNRPIVPMVLHWRSNSRTTVHVLFDTECSTPLIAKTLVDKWGIPVLKHKHPIPLYNFSGEMVPGAGQEFSRPALLQHRNHYTRKVFEVAPLEPDVDVFLPLWWIAKHPPQGAWDSPELRFSSPNCLNNCT
jgi:hypothetical protein